MKRNKRIVLLANCLLNTNAKVYGISTVGGASPLVSKLVEEGYGIIQLPCMEMTMFGTQRWGIVYEQCDFPEFRKRCREVLEPLVLQVKDFHQHGYEISAVIGVDGSPNCAVNVTCSGDWGGELSGSMDYNDRIQAVKESNKSGVMKVGMCPEYPPFETINKSGDIEGFDADLATAIGKEIGVKVEFVNTPYEGLIAGLMNGDFDIIMSGMSPREADEADKSLNVSESYYVVSEVIMTKDPSIKSKKDLAGKKVGSHVGSTSEYAVNNLIKEDKIKCTSVPYNRHSEAFADLVNGNIDATVTEDTWAKQKVGEDKDVKILDGSIYDIEIAAICDPDSASLRDAFNEAFKTIKDNGTYDKIVEKWFS